MEAEKFILCSNYKISSFDSDFKGNTKIGALINYFIQIAWQHAEELGWGLEELDKQGYGWVLSRLKLKLNALPKWPGEISIETWPKGLNRLFYIRDAVIIEKDSKPNASITSAWLIIDKKTKRPKLYKPDLEMLSHNQERHAIHEEIQTLKIDGKPVYSVPYKAKYTDIDINQHLTTVKYIDYLFDTYDLEFIKKNTPKELTFNFLKEIKFGTELIMNRYESDNIHFFELINTQNKTVCFRAELKY